MFLYVIKHGAVLGISGGLLTVKYPDMTEEAFPKQTIEGISIFSKVLMTTACVEFCLTNNISVGYFTMTGHYYGRLVPVMNSNVQRLRKQIQLSGDERFSVRLAQRIIKAKISNQLVVARRYSKNDSATSDNRKILRVSKDKVSTACSLYKLIGFEGIASKNYFATLSNAIEEGFAFEGRNRRPAVDPFNCMLNIGYSILTKEIVGEIENRGLNPYVGFIHKDKVGHPTLASDLIEEWRPVIVDSLVMSMIQGHEVCLEDFIVDENGCRLKDDALRLFISKLERRLETKNNYLIYLDSPLSFRSSIWHQVDRLSRAIDKEDPEIYYPIIIR